MSNARSKLESLSSWTIELTAALVSVASLFGLIGVLLYADGRPVITFHSLTLNTIVSMFATASKMSAMAILCASISQAKWIIFRRGPRSLRDFERVELASRGSVAGVGNMLFLTRGVATIGAIAILLAVAWDPFLQALVKLKPGTLYTFDPRATLPRAQRYSAGSWTPISGVSILNEDGTIADNITAVYTSSELSIQSATLYGLTHSMLNATQQLPLHCPSGNCTWPLTESLAVCSICNDLSTSVETSALQDSPTWTYLSRSNSGAAMMNMTRYTLPNNLFIDNADTIEDPEIAFTSGEALGLMMTSFGTADPGLTVSLADVDTLIWATTMLRVPAGSTKWPPVKPIEATECALYYCVKEYNTTVVNNTIVELSRVTDATRRSDSWQPEDEMWSMGNLTTEQLESVAFRPASSSIKRTDLTLGQDFNLSQSAVNGISEYFQTTFMNWTINERNGVDGAYDFGRMNGYYINTSNPDWLPSVMQPLRENPDLNETFAIIATSMSNAIRAGSDGKATIAGNNGRPVTRFRIDWPWITLPAVVIFAAIVQLLLVIRESHKSETPVWKGSTLATMSHGKYVTDVLDGQWTVKDMGKAADQQRVNLFQYEVPDSVVGRSHEVREVKGAQSRVQEVV